jgi:hypothetical protein
MGQIREGMRVTWENEQKKNRKVAKTHGMILVSVGASEIVGAYQSRTTKYKERNGNFDST